MAIPVSIFLIAVGLVLALAVHTDNSGVDVNTVGWILFAVGGLGLLLTLLFWNTWAGPGYWSRRRTVYEPPPVPPRRRTIVEEEEDLPPGPPGPP